MFDDHILISAVILANKGAKSSPSKTPTTPHLGTLLVKMFKKDILKLVTGNVEII